MKESISKLMNLKPSGKISNKKSEDQQWLPPLELEKKIIKRERFKLFVFVLLSNACVLILTATKEEHIPAPRKSIIISKNHSVIQLKASILVPIETDEKKEISVFTETGKFVTKGKILPKDDQEPVSELGPWKIEIENKSLSKIFKYNKDTLKVVPKQTSELKSKRNIHEIMF